MSTHLPEIEPSTAHWIERADFALATTTIHSRFVPASGNGVRLKDIEGRPIMNMTSFVGVCNLGYGEAIREIRDVVRAHEDITGLSHTMTHDWVSPLAVKLAELLISVTPGSHPKKVFFSTSGTEANEAAIKLL